jgi:hypothetical protein
LNCSVVALDHVVKVKIKKSFCPYCRCGSPFHDNGIEDAAFADTAWRHQRGHEIQMSSFQELDPRLRDSSGTTLSASIATNASAQQQYPHIQDGSPQQNLYPHTPQSGGNTTDRDGATGAHDGGPNDPKRPRACEGYFFLASRSVLLG